MTNIQNFRDTFKGTRSNRFKIQGYGSESGAATDIEGAPSPTTPNIFEIYAKAASFPGTQIGMIPVAYQGRIVKFTGERQFGEWTIVVYDGSVSGGKNLREYMENWIEDIDSAKGHIQRYANASTDPWLVKFDDVGTDSTSSDTDYKKIFQLFNCWPMDISPIDLSYEAVDSFSEFTLTLAYDYHIDIST